jgi:hypothetical protein
MDFTSDENTPKSKTYKVLQDVGNWAKKFEASSSDYDKGKTVSYANAMNMIGDIVGQLYQQRFVAQIPKWLGLDSNTMNLQRNFITAMSKDYKAKYGDDLITALSKGTVVDDFAKTFKTGYLKQFYAAN